MMSYSLKSCGNRHAYCKCCRPDVAANLSKASAGRKPSSEHIAKIATANTGKKRSVESLQRMSQAQKIRQTRPEQRQHLSEVQKGRKRSLEIRQRISEGHRGKRLSFEHRQHIKKTVKQWWEIPEHLAKQSAVSKNWWQDPEYRKRVNAQWENPQRLAKHITDMKANWKNLEYRKKMTDVLARNRRKRPTGIEKILFNLVALLFPGYDIRTQYRIGKRFVDISVPALYLAFEADGEYWHRNTTKADSQRDAELGKMGWATIRFSQQELLGLETAEVKP